MYAIISTGGKQYKVSTGDIIEVEKLAAQAGETVALDLVALTDGAKVVVDAATLAGVKATAQVLEQFKGKKQEVFKFEKRKNYKKLNGHRQQLTRIQITDVNVDADKAAKAAAKKVEVSEAAEKKEAPAKAAAPKKAPAKAAEKAASKDKAVDAVVKPAAEKKPAAKKAAAPKAAAAKKPAAKKADAPAEEKKPAAKKPAAKKTKSEEE